MKKIPDRIPESDESSDVKSKFHSIVMGRSWLHLQAVLSTIVMFSPMVFADLH
jgi:hypothetical protein